MFVIDGIAYAGEKNAELTLTEAKSVGDFILLLTFSSGEQRPFDGTEMIKLPAFEPLRTPEAFSAFSLNRGLLTWRNGSLNISADYLYDNSYTYQSPEMLAV